MITLHTRLRQTNRQIDRQTDRLTNIIAIAWWFVLRMHHMLMTQSWKRIWKRNISRSSIYNLINNANIHSQILHTSHADDDHVHRNAVGSSQHSNRHTHTHTLFWESLSMWTCIGRLILDFPNFICSKPVHRTLNLCIFPLTSSRCWDMAIFQFFKITAIRHPALSQLIFK